LKTGTVTVAMNGFMGPAQTEAEKQKAYMTKRVFRFVSGQVTENGKPVN
jgi:hypothetical protein